MPDEQNNTAVETTAPPVVTPAPQSQELPDSGQDFSNTDTISDADWAIFDKTKPAHKATATGEPIVEEKPKEEPPKPVQQDAKPEERKEPAKDQQKPNEDELPDLDKLDDNIPTNHRALVKQRNKLGKELRLSRGKEKELSDKIAGLEERLGKASTPEKEAELQKKIDALNADVERERGSRAEAEDRLYASNVANRPEWQKYVVEPWATAKDTMKALAKRNSFSAEDVWEAYKLPAEQRDQAYSEMLETMNRRDQHTFNAIIDGIPQIVANQKHLELDSKEKRDAFKQREEARQEQERTKRTGTALQTAQSLFEENKKNLPGLFDPQGDSEEIKGYRAQIENTRKLAEDIARKGVDSLKPEIQGRMVHDALFADTLRNGFNIVLQAKVKEIGDLQAKNKELEAANKSLQDTVDSYADGTSLVSQGGQRGVPVAKTNGDESVSDLLGKYFPNMR